MIKKLKPGDEVYHVDRDEYDYPVEATGTVYLATIADYVVSVASPVGCFSVEEIMEYLAETTREDFNGDIYVHHVGDCYETYDEAENAWKNEELHNERHRES